MRGYGCQTNETPDCCSITWKVTKVTIADSLTKYYNYKLYRNAKIIFKTIIYELFYFCNWN